MREFLEGLLVVAIIVGVVSSFVYGLHRLDAADKARNLACLQAGHSNGILRIAGQDWCYRVEGDRGELRLLKSLEGCKLPTAKARGLFPDP